MVASSKRATSRKSVERSDHEEKENELFQVFRHRARKEKDQSPAEKGANLSQNLHRRAGDFCRTRRRLFLSRLSLSRRLVKKAIRSKQADLCPGGADIDRLSGRGSRNNFSRAPEGRRIKDRMMEAEWIS